ncbi:epsin-2 [Trichonephila clavata]|uniref:Epsin-2 n=1 Tax=Trichonephila clavata TaxID=2740835 RepID=A0A8X6LCV5_TRICU|nr:epsin-2 [Trichonephila clavata]
MAVRFLSSQMQNDPWSPVSEGAFPSPSESQQHVCVSIEDGVPSLDAFLGQQSDLICSRPRNTGNPFLAARPCPPTINEIRALTNQNVASQNPFM